MTEERSDCEIIADILQGDSSQFAHLVERYKRYVFAILSKHVPRGVIDEIAQDAFIQIYDSLSDFRGESEFRHWVATITIRRSYDYWRRVRRTREVPFSSFSAQHRNWLEQAIETDAKAVFFDDQQREYAKQVLERALHQLSAEDRAVITLHHLEGHSVRETAQLLGWSISAVKVRAFRSRSKLHRIIKKLLK